MKSTFINKRQKPSLFQVLLLDNDDSLDVEVQESEQVNFSQVKEHLRNGGSVFITSKDSQKLIVPKIKNQQSYARSRRTVGFLFHQRLMKS
ncbi:MAG: hypothetical protein NWE98_06535 [Candidatus Bathyarchaeota archaeon]|nr:hypothetical protein [Candidatus Bathyarchaeota archaeon]